MRFLYTDNGGIIRGKATHVDSLAHRLTDGIGLTVAMQAMNMLDQLQPVEGIRYTEVISLAPRAVLPATILDAVPGVDYDSTLASENVGILDIRSVYDFDGADFAPGGYASLIDPVQTTADERPARFVETTLIRPLDEASQQNIDVRQSFKDRPPPHASWTAEHKETFRRFCGPAMERMGYDVPF